MFNNLTNVYCADEKCKTLAMREKTTASDEVSLHFTLRGHGLMQTDIHKAQNYRLKCMKTG